jgi:hypothetical protein
MGGPERGKLAMRLAVSLILCAALSPVPLTARAASAAPPSQSAPGPVTVESYYRIRWGSFWDFMDIYRQHHAPILAEMQRLGFITAIHTDTPLTHMAGDQRWDLRVTITYRDGNAATGADGGAYDRAVKAASTWLFPDNSAHLAAETRRFAMIEEHWDVIVSPYTE